MLIQKTVYAQNDSLFAVLWTELDTDCVREEIRIENLYFFINENRFLADRFFQIPFPKVWRIRNYVAPFRVILTKLTISSYNPLLIETQDVALPILYSSSFKKNWFYASAINYTDKTFKSICEYGK